MPDPVDPSYTNLNSEEMEVGLKVARVGLGTVDFVADTLRLDRLSADLFDLPDGVDIPRADLHARIHPDDWPDVEHHIEAMLDPSRPEVLDLTHRILGPDGAVRWVNARKEVQFGSDARPATGVFAVVDVTDRKLAEIRSETLIGELNHRTKNLVTVVSAITRQLKGHGVGADFPDRLISRLEALARNQDAMVRSSAVHFELHGLIKAQLQPFEGRHADRVSLRGDAMQISPIAAQALGMAFHELTTNAVKYGALSNAAGQVEISWGPAAGEPGHWTLIWQERGGPKIAPPSRSGFGQQVLTSFLETTLEAEAVIDFQPDGLHAAFTVPNERLSGG